MLQFGSLVFAMLSWYFLSKYPYPVPELVVRREEDTEKA